MAACSSSGKQQTSLLVGVMLPILGLFASLATSLWAGNLDSAQQLYQRTAYEAALRALGAEGSQDAMVLLLAGQIYYQLGKYQEASERLEKASELQPGSAEIFLWLGRSLGRRAEASSFLTAPGYARRCREALEQAVALNGKHLEAMSDLAAFYLEAPGFLGGGLEKAASWHRGLRRWTRPRGTLCRHGLRRKGRISQVPRHTYNRQRRWRHGRSIG